MFSFFAIKKGKEKHEMNLRKVLKFPCHDEFSKSIERLSSNYFDSILEEISTFWHKFGC